MQIKKQPLELDMKKPTGSKLGKEFVKGGASHGGSERPGNLEVGGASRDSTGFGALEEGLISS